MAEITDEEWAAKVEAAANRKPPETDVTLRDPNAQATTAKAIVEQTAARRRAKVKLRTTKPDLDEDELTAAVDKVAEVKRADKAVEEAKAAELAAEITFHLRALPPTLYDHMQLKHPPTEEQEKRGQIWNGDTFYPALLAACSVRPISVEKATGILGSGNAGDLAQFYVTLRNLNEQGHLTLGKGSAPTRS